MESIETLNQRLKEHFGVDDSNRPMWRIVWSEDQYEKRWTEYTREGFKLLYPEVQELPKYKQWIHNKYILEHLVIIPPGTDRVDTVSYEVIFVFEDKDFNPLPPNWTVAKFAIDNVNAAMGKESLGPKYTDPDTTIESREQRIKELEKELFGNETTTGDMLAHGGAIVVPTNYETSKD